MKPYLFAFAAVLLLVIASAVAQDIRQTIPIPVPLGMGGTGFTVPVSVGSLPSCSASNEGQLMVVTNALTPAALVAVVGGGAVHVMVACLNSAWIVL